MTEIQYVLTHRVGAQADKETGGDQERRGLLGLYIEKLSKDRNRRRHRQHKAKAISVTQKAVQGPSDNPPNGEDSNCPTVVFRGTEWEETRIG